LNENTGENIRLRIKTGKPIYKTVGEKAPDLSRGDESPKSL
jgi:hypothetical protein